MKKMFVVFLVLIAVAAYADELSIGATAPAFRLVNAADAKLVAFKPGDGKVSVIVFTCNQCPYAKAFEPRIVEIAKRYQDKGVAFYAIDSNDDTKYDVETLANMKERAVKGNYSFPYLKDANSQVAREYGARVTPHAFVVDGKGALRYRGYVDDNARAEERSDTGLTNALDALLANQPVATASTKAFGCSIKWKG